MPGNPPAARIVSGTKAVTTAGTEVQLASTNVGVAWVVVTAWPGNTGTIIVGDSSIVATAGAERGVVLGAGDGVALPVGDLADIYIDATVNGEGVGFLYGVTVA